MDTYRLVTVERHGDVACLRLRKSRLDESEIHDLAHEALAVLSSLGCSRAALSLGPNPPECLYSVFLAKLVSVRNELRKKGGDLVLIEVGPIAYAVFEACVLHREFVFLPDLAAAVGHFGAA
jgi:hypothetical protein